MRAVLLVMLLGLVSSEAGADGAVTYMADTLVAGSLQSLHRCHASSGSSEAGLP